MEWINFRHLYSFWMVKRHGGFLKASQEMHVSQSTVSEQVSLLEEYLQEKLFERTTRSMHLSEAGIRLFNFADEIFQKSREINRIIRDGEGGREPLTLKVGIVGGVSRNLLYRAFHGFLNQSDDLKLEIINGAFEELLQLCGNFELDFIITTQLPHGKDVLNFKTKVIEKSPLCVAGKKKIIKKLTNDKSKPQKIDAYVFSYPFRHNDFESRLNKTFPHSFNYKLETDDISLLRFFANSNEGVAILPEIGVLEDVQKGDIEILKIPFTEDLPFYALYHRKTMHIKEVEDLIKASFKDF